MGLFDWIGEAIGGAFHALSEFIADGFQGILNGMGSAAKGISKDLMKDVVITAQDPNDPVHQGAKTLYEKATEPITKGFDHTVAELSKNHSEITPQQANKEVLEIYDKVRIDTGVATMTHIAIEAASLGQLEGPMTAFQMADRISGATSFANQVAMMKYKALWLTSYEHHLNATNPNMRPGPSDLIRFAFREVWDPTRRAELLQEGYPVRFAEEMLFQGYNQEWANDYWAAHWELPSIGQLNEMLHRRVITPEIWDRFVKYNDFDPVIRPWLKAISYSPYTRVDVRRLKDLELVSDQEVYENFQDLGYDDVHARRMTIWTLAYNISVSMRARYSKGWVTADDAQAALVKAGVPADRARTWVQQMVADEKETRTTPERDLTKAEIVKGVKKEFLSVDEGIELLEGMGYDAAEAEYVLAINVEALTGSPETYTEFKTLVDLRRKSQGLRVKEAPPGLIELEDRLVRLRERRKNLMSANSTSELIAKIDQRIEDVQQQHRELRGKKAP